MKASYTPETYPPMKSIQRFKHLFRRTLLGSILALFTTGAARGTWYEQPVADVTEVVYTDHGAVDTNWNIYYCSSPTEQMYAIYNPGPGANWIGSRVAANCSTSWNNIACDSVNHWTFYTGSDGYIWVIFWNGSAWAQIKVGSNLNHGSQLCVDSVYHCLWYLDNSNYLWILYFNGSIWVEVKLDGTNSRSGIGGRFCGVDSTWHIAWYLTLDRKSLRGTYWSGTGWTNGPAIGTLPGAERYMSLACQESTHTPFNWQDNGSGTSTKGGYLWWSGNAWLAGTSFQDDNLPTSPGYCIVSPNPYCCLFGGTASSGACYFTGWNSHARNWASCRQDNATMGGGTGLIPLACGQDGRAILCKPYTGNYVRMLFSDVP